MQLWTRMAQQQHAAQLGASPAHPAPLSGLAAGLRPHYFATPPSASASFKSASVPAASPKDAVLAAMASQTLLQRLGSAFWDAFAGTPAPAATAGAVPRAPAWDAEKVRRVLEGRAVVRIVDVEPVRVKDTVLARAQDAVPAPTSASASTSACVRAREAGTCALTEMLEESMRALSLGKK